MISNNSLSEVLYLVKVRQDLCFPCLECAISSILVGHGVFAFYEHEVGGYFDFACNGL